MKVIKKEHGIELTAENAFERECLKHVANKQLTAKFENSWDQDGSLNLEFDAHPWT